MKRAIWYLVLVLSLSLFLVSGVWAGELEDKLLQTAGSCNINLLHVMLIFSFFQFIQPFNQK